MRNIIDLKIASSLAALALLGGGLAFPAAAAPVRYQTHGTNSLVRLQGTSTLHDWEMKGVLIAGWVEFAGPVQFDTNQATLAGLQDGKLPVTAQANFPIRFIHSEADHLPGTMDSLMQDALKEKQFPRIQYRVTSLKLNQPHAPGAPFEFEAEGELAIAGVTNHVTFPVTIVPVDQDNIKISGKYTLKMTDYKVTPPAPNFGLGLMKCGNEVVILFDWALAPAPKQP